MDANLPKVAVVLLAFIDQDGRIMLNRRADADSEMWELIGGGVEADETPYDAIRREIEEEVGYKLSDLDDLNLVKVFNFENHKFSAKVHCFTAIYPGKDKFMDSDETFVDDIEMFSLEDANKLVLLPMTRLFLVKANI